jgi:hypothetical protein
VPCSERALRTAWASFLDPLCITARSRISPTLSIPLVRSHVQRALPRYHPQSSPVLDLKLDVCSLQLVHLSQPFKPAYLLKPRDRPRSIHYRIVQPYDRPSRRCPTCAPGHRPPSGRGFGRRRLLTAPQRIGAVTRTPDVVVGAVDPWKRQVVTATRYSLHARSGAKVSLEILSFSLCVTESQCDMACVDIDVDR